MSDDILLHEQTDSIARLTLNMPGKLNALSNAMIAAIQIRLDTIASDETVKAVVISGSGKAFCAGHDLREMTAARQVSDGGAAAFQDLFDRCAAMMTTIQKIPQPVIAQVHGTATAAGCQLVASCDMAVAADTTKFGVNGVNIGLFCATPMVALTRNIARKKAFEMLTTGEFIDAETAKDYGLINRFCAPADLADETDKLAATVASKLAVAVRIGKQAFYRQLEMGIEDAYAYTGAVMVENMAETDTEEGIAAFLEKRPPNWD